MSWFRSARYQCYLIIEKLRSQRRLSTVYGLPSSQSFVYTLSMASVLEETKKTRCRIFLEVVTTSTG